MDFLESLYSLRKFLLKRLIGCNWLRKVFYFPLFFSLIHTKKYTNIIYIFWILEFSPWPWGNSLFHGSKTQHAYMILWLEFWAYKFYLERRWLLWGWRNLLKETFEFLPYCELQGDHRQPQRQRDHLQRLYLHKCHHRPLHICDFPKGPAQLPSLQNGNLAQFTEKFWQLWVNILLWLPLNKETLLSHQSMRLAALREVFFLFLFLFGLWIHAYMFVTFFFDRGLALRLLAFQKLAMLYFDDKDLFICVELICICVVVNHTHHAIHDLSWGPYATSHLSLWANKNFTVLDHITNLDKWIVESWLLVYNFHDTWTMILSDLSCSCVFFCYASQLSWDFF